MSGLNNRIALVTGGSRGIGKAIALALANLGAGVAVNYRERAEEAASVVETIHRSQRPRSRHSCRCVDRSEISIDRRSYSRPLRFLSPPSIIRVESDEKSNVLRVTKIRVGQTKGVSSWDIDSRVNELRDKLAEALPGLAIKIVTMRAEGQTDLFRLGCYTSVLTPSGRQAVQRLEGSRFGALPFHPREFVPTLIRPKRAKTGGSRE
ncbi:MAG: SDR family NAD(P)-dependent oxidoreductase [Chthoniobacterales bacterium]